MKTLGGLLTLFITMPIWYYLIYKILTLVVATELMWFLYWVYLPIGITAQILVKIAEGQE